VSAEEIAGLVVDLVRDESSAGRVVLRPAGGSVTVLPSVP
jgi:hypothetical protein